MPELKRAQLNAVIDELKSMRAEGIDSVYIGNQTLENLEALCKPGKNAASVPSSSAAGDAPAQVVPKAVEASHSQDDRSVLHSYLSSSGGTDQSSSTKPTRVQPAKSGKADLPDWIKPVPAPEAFEIPEADKPQQWEWLRERVLKDPVCQEHVRMDRGKKVVFGVGDINAELFFCGEAPGEDEETIGEPFVGKAGQLLDKIIGAMGLKREQVYIGNIMNWRPEHDKPWGNRPPTETEINYCLPYLEAQVAIVKPKVIVALGATAAHGLLGYDPQRTVGRTRGRWLDYSGVPLLLTYHPSYLLRNGSKKAKRMVWEDMMLAMERIGLSISEKQRGYFM